jgi:uncharacterized Zn-finger protein
LNISALSGLRLEWKLITRLDRAGFLMTSSAKQAPTAKANQRQASTEQAYTVKRADLPLSCPSPDMMLWNSHPRVYLPIEKTGRALCPYCGAEYTLED